MKSFIAYQLEREAVAIDVLDSPAGPIVLRSWRRLGKVPEGGSAIVLPLGGSAFVWPGGAFMIEGRGYALVPGGTEIMGGAGLIIHTPLYTGLVQAGGPCEAFGRLRYIDGCSDSLLISPALRGQPCLNLLHLPPGTAQTAHTHPSDRVGIIVAGRGVCKTPAGDTPLEPGMFWYIPTDTVHSFHTEEIGLDVIAWHPDSDFGPSDDQHPMINRTIVDGTPANDARHAAIRTT